MNVPHGSASGSAPDSPARPVTGDGRAGLKRLTLRRTGRDGLDDAAGAAPGASEWASDAPRTGRNAARDDALAREAAAADEREWRSVGLFGAGLVLGALLGAGTALLMAPATGFETRARLAHRARGAREQAADRLDEFGDRVRSGARRSRRKLARKMMLTRWRAQDAWERKRYGSP